MKEEERNENIEEKQDSVTDSNPAIEKLAQFEPILEKQNPKGENIESFSDIYLNFGIVFKTSIATYVRIRQFLLDNNVTLIYQKKSFEKLFILPERLTEKPQP